MTAFDIMNSAGISKIGPKIGIKPGKAGSWGPCPKCRSNKRGSEDIRLPIGVTPNGSGWRCHVCKSHGSMTDLVSCKIAGDLYRSSGPDDNKKVLNWALSNGFSLERAKEKIVTIDGLLDNTLRKEFISPPDMSGSNTFRWDERLPDIYAGNLFSDEGKPVLDYLIKHRKISETVIREATLGYMKSKGKHWLVIPLKDQFGKIVNMRFRSVPPDIKTYRVCPSRPMPLYGLDQLSADKSKFVIVTEGELDVLALRTYGYNSTVVSGTTGASANWCSQWLDSMEPYQGFYLWYDNDNAGDEGSEKLASKLGKFRCFRIKSKKYNDPGEALQKNAEKKEIGDILSNYDDYFEATLRNVESYSDDIEELIKNPQSLAGLPMGSQKLDTMFGGIRPGLWVVTGDTGHGKTTWATWLMWEQALRGVPVLLTSFEQRPIGTVQKLLRHQLGNDFTTHTEAQRRIACEELGKLPIMILDHYGELGVEKVISTIRYSVRRHNLKIALIDHLGFLTKPDGNVDERLAIESIVRRLATIAINDNITIVLICHPNNLSVNQQRRVKITDLKGASAIRQDAHVGIVVQRLPLKEEGSKPSTVIYADKVRSEFGKAGSHCVMAFDPLACIYADQWNLTPAGKRNARVVIPK